MIGGKMFSYCIDDTNKEVTFIIDTQKNRYFFGFGLFYFFYTRVNKNNVNDNSYYKIGKTIY